jgi:hypothetical protein
MILCVPSMSFLEPARVCVDRDKLIGCRVDAESWIICARESLSSKHSKNCICGANADVYILSKTNYIATNLVSTPFKHTHTCEIILYILFREIGAGYCMVKRWLD